MLVGVEVLPPNALAGWLAGSWAGPACAWQPPGPRFFDFLVSAPPPAPSGAPAPLNKKQKQARRRRRNFRGTPTPTPGTPTSDAPKSFATPPAKTTRDFGDKDEWKAVLKGLQQDGALTYSEASDTITLSAE